MMDKGTRAILVPVFGVLAGHSPADDYERKQE